MNRWRDARVRMEEALRGYPVRFLPTRDPRTEQAAFPKMVEHYWRLAGDCEGLPPQQEQFALPLLAMLPSLPMEGVLARAYRTWPSLVRQHHFELVLRERFDLVLRGHTLDMLGLDFLLIVDGHAYGVALSVQTSAARGWQRVKARRHPIPAGLPVLELYLDRSAAPRFGAVDLHPAAQADEVRSWLDWTRERTCPVRAAEVPA